MAAYSIHRPNEGRGLSKRVGILFGMERSFPAALAEAVNSRGRGEVAAEPVRVGVPRQEDPPAYDVILDRISHEVPFYRSYLKAAVLHGAQVVNNPFWWSADDKFLDNVLARAAGVAVPRTVLLPHKEHPPNTGPDSFTNLAFPLDWDAVFAYLGFPIFLKPANGGGWRDVHRVRDPEEFFRAYDRSHTLPMMAQEAIEFTEYFRCYVLGRKLVRVMRYDPGAEPARRYVPGAPPPAAPLAARVERDARALCEALGYDVNTVEFAVRDGVPVAIDFMNPAPDCDVRSVGEENFRWVVENTAEMLVERALHPRPFRPAGAWAGAGR
jgi:glutathione synthase/RimK-type ligase-like ATP-grasp enzyme